MISLYPLKHKKLEVSEKDNRDVMISQNYSVCGTF